jgi:cytochrome b subunit of formate dehydrogenase
MFRMITIAILVVTVGAALAHMLVVKAKGGSGCAAKGKRRLNLWERLVLLGMTGTVGVLALTSLLPRLFTNELMTGYLLMIHVTFGGVFAACLAAAAVTWAWDSRFEKGDGAWLKAGGCLAANNEAPGRFSPAQKALFWLMLALGVVSGVSIALSMIPLLGQEGQHLMFNIHRCVSLLLLAVAIWLAYCGTIAPKRCNTA